MNALEAKATALEKQNARWMKLPMSVKRDIEHATYCGELHCITTYNLVDQDIQNLRMLGYKVRDIIEDNYEISWA